MFDMLNLFRRIRPNAESLCSKNRRFWRKSLVLGPPLAHFSMEKPSSVFFKINKTAFRAKGIGKQIEKQFFANAAHFYLGRISSGQNNIFWAEKYVMGRKSGFAEFCIVFG